MAHMWGKSKEKEDGKRENTSIILSVNVFIFPGRVHICWIGS